MARKPFFSGNYGSALARVDTRPIMEAGRAQGQMYANMGKQIGGLIKEYGLNKEKQGKITDKIENRLKLDPSIAQRLTMTGDEDFDKKNVTDMEKLASGELGLKGLQRLDSAMATINEVDLQKQAEEDREMKKSAFKLSQLTQQLSNDNTRLRNQIAELTKGDVVKGAAADANAKTSQANMLGDDEAYYKTDKALDRENKQSLIDYRKAAKTTGTFGTGFNAEEKEIPYSEYKENPDDYAPLVSDQLKGLQLQEDTLKEELSQLTLSTPIPYTNNDTGAQGITTVGEMLKFQKQSKNNTPTNPQSMPLGQEDMMMLDQPGTTIGVPQVPNFSR